MAQFATTRWSLVLAARGGTQLARGALETLCGIYRPAVVQFVRRLGHDADAAEDLTQSFFVHFLEHDVSARADRARGSFRAYLLTAIRHFVSNDARAGRSARRGGGVLLSEWVDDAAIDEDTPDAAFHRAWALSLLRQALDKLRDEAAAAGKSVLFRTLRDFLVEAPEPVDYERAAASLGLRRNTVAVAVHRLRQRLQELVREEIADTVGDSAEAEVEIRQLREVLAKSAVIHAV